MEFDGDCWRVRGKLWSSLLLTTRAVTQETGGMCCRSAHSQVMGIPILYYISRMNNKIDMDLSGCWRSFMKTLCAGIIFILVGLCGGVFLCGRR